MANSVLWKNLMNDKFLYHSLDYSKMDTLGKGKCVLCVTCLEG